MAQKFKVTFKIANPITEDDTEDMNKQLKKIKATIIGEKLKPKNGEWKVSAKDPALLTEDSLELAAKKCGLSKTLKNFTIE